MTAWVAGWEEDGGAQATPAQDEQRVRRWSALFSADNALEEDEQVMHDADGFDVHGSRLRKLLLGLLALKPRGGADGKEVPF